MLTNDKNEFSPLSWGTHKCTLAAEALALKDALEHGIYVSHLLSEIYHDSYVKSMFVIVGVTDNLSLDKALRSSKQVDDKRLNVDLASIRQMQKEDNIKISWKEGSKKLADSFTKINSNSVDCF